jgi:DNA-binding transcriptional ArsR family regulator
MLKALANRRRLAILAYLKKNREASVTEIAEQIRLSVKATSRHLRVLAAADLVEYEQRSLLVYYRLPAAPPQPFKTVLTIL